VDQADRERDPAHKWNPTCVARDHADALPLVTDQVVPSRRTGYSRAARPGRTLSARSQTQPRAETSARARQPRQPALARPHPPPAALHPTTQRP
jgi:hypothetical protein